jgi:hypothetical protein
MIPFSISKPMTSSQIVEMTAVLLRVARVDAACTKEEIALIRAFYGANGADESMPAFDVLLDKPSRATTKGDVLLPDVEHREFVLAACVMVAYADGQLSDAERNAIHEVGLEIGVPDKRIGEIVSVVQDHLLAQLSHLPDSGAVVKVAQELAGK